MATVPATLPAATPAPELVLGHQIPQDDLPNPANGKPAQFTCNLQVDYATEELARIVMVTLMVDPELQPDKVKREMAVEGRRLVTTFSALEARFLRASFSAFMDLLVLATRTIELYGPGTKYMP